MQFSKMQPLHNGLDQCVAGLDNANHRRTPLDITPADLNRVVLYRAISKEIGLG
jgi:hypothetical protein